MIGIMFGDFTVMRLTRMMASGTNINVLSAECTNGLTNLLHSLNHMKLRRLSSNRVGLHLTTAKK